ncbi:disulfide isomerase/thiol-disulfide oxidase [Pseudomonas aeruginosa]|nr:disulfide isomerase/thiol-disulfide oxidase [Pseudomonas aeruginosa]
MRLPRNLITLGLGLTLLNAGLATAAEELPAPIRMVQEKGARILGSFDAPDGLRGYAAEYQNQGMALYLTPDGKHVLTGHLFDAQGKDLSREPLERLVYAPLAKEMWQKMEQSAWIADGRADAPRVVYLFSDPNCPYCTMFWEQARPWVDAGKVQLRHIMVGIIREDSEAKSAALLASKDPQKALHDHEQAGKASTLKPLAKIPAAVRKQLAGNMELMESMAPRRPRRSSISMPRGACSSNRARRSRTSWRRSSVRVDPPGRRRAAGHLYSLRYANPAERGPWTTHSARKAARSRAMTLSVRRWPRGATVSTSTPTIPTSSPIPIRCCG